VGVEIVKSYVASTGVCHYVVRSTTYRPRTSGGGHGDIRHGDDDSVHGASVNYFFAHVLSSTGPDVAMHVPASPSPATQRNKLLQRVCGTRERIELHRRRTTVYD